MPNAKQHRRNRDRALAERTETIDELIARCRAMTTEQFAQLPQTLLQRLTPSQKATILAGLPSAGSVLAKQNGRTEKTAVRPQTPIRRTVPPARSVWRRMIIASLGWGIAFSVTVFAFFTVPPLLFDGAEIVRPVRSAFWPKCSRLTPRADGCVYVVTYGLSWSLAAGLLNMQEASLRSLNQVPNGTSLNAGQAIVVWRGRGRLVQ